MKKKITVITLATIIAATGTAFGSGYRIPEQSMNSVALSGAYVANTQGADTSYFNPANMGWLADGWHSEANLGYIHLTSIDYADNDTPAKNGSSKKEDFLLPQLHLVSPAFGNFRFGLSVTYPAGLSKRWEAAFPKSSAEDFTLKTYEFNPTVSYKISDRIAIGGGARIIHSTGKVKSTAVDPIPGTVSLLIRDMKGDTTEYGYNLALTIKPVTNLTLAATYRSKVDLDEEGDATLLAMSPAGGGTVIGTYSGGASVSVPVPAVLTFGAAYTFDRTTVELTYDKTYWNAYEQLDFNYTGALTDPFNILTPAFDTPRARNWTNSEAYRIGVTHQFNEQWTMMAAFAIDKNPVPDNTLAFELPDSDAKIYSIGARYQYNDKLLVGLAYLYDDKESRTVTNSSVDGTFDNAAAHLVSANLQYRF
ncbi:MAG: outer membrane protein transport protein [Desulfobulbaceae bacterium]|nr:outer membrane protein transport protein [Desulfobulbaceae bacterium]HIJ78140.1 hypothetical protein [Deltaproteobacteria bacterium]